MAVINKSRRMPPTMAKALPQCEFFAGAAALGAGTDCACAGLDCGWDAALGVAAGWPHFMQNAPARCTPHLLHRLGIVHPKSVPLYSCLARERAVFLASGGYARSASFLSASPSTRMV